MTKITTLKLLALLLPVLAISSCKGQNQSPAISGSLVGGGCDGCEIMYVGMPAYINATDTSAGWKEAGQKLLVTGTVFQQDGRTPAPQVVIYYWQTDHEGFYSPRQNLDQRAERHGHIRGWVKTDAAGKYAIYTIRPGAYPNRAIPAHLHISIKEPDIANEYYTDELVFDNDPLLTTAERQKLERRGGSGILRTHEQSGKQVGDHDIILGLNIPNYPAKFKTTQSSGLAIGEESPSFTPFHAWGPDKGSIACPVCKYGRNFGILYFVGNKPDWLAIRKWLLFLEKQSECMAGELKVYFVYGNEGNYSKSGRTRELETLGKELGIRHLALTFVSSFKDQKSDVYLNKIDPQVPSTMIIYKNRIIIDRYTAVPPTTGNFDLVLSKIRAY